MTIQIAGDCLAANTARMKTKAAKLVGGAFPLVEKDGTFLFRIEMSAHTHIIVDSVDSELERCVINQIAKSFDVLLCRKEGVSSEFELRLAIPDFLSEADQVRIGSVMSDAIVRYFHFEDSKVADVQLPGVVSPWWKIW